MPRVIHFEIPADDPERAADFYTKVFGWEVKKWEGPQDYWMVMTGPEKEPGINGAIMKRLVPIAGDSVIAYINSISVSSVDEYVKRILDNGGVLTMPKVGISKVGWLAYCKDTEGNIFGILEEDKNVK
ncbi:VOC family protein [Candidatus Parcubacteria bacterium]|nr:MAG: VOC family protein [Candidatus Parcubacteria bacterium]